jgi:hypothetical protein
MSAMKRKLVYELKNLLPDPVRIAVHEDLVISEDMDTEVDRAAGYYGFFAVLSEKAESRYERLKAAFELWQSEQTAMIFQEAKDGDEKKPTEKQVDARVKSHPKWKKFKFKLIELDEHKRVLKVIAKAMDKKADLIQTKSANRRSEVSP